MEGKIISQAGGQKVMFLVHKVECEEDTLKVHADLINLLYMRTFLSPKAILCCRFL